MPDPTTIRVLGKQYSIVESSELEIWGRTKPDKQTINIQEGLAPEARRETLLHEVIHAAVADVMVDTQWLTEAQVAALSGLLFATLCDNPHIVDYIFGRPGE